MFRCLAAAALSGGARLLCTRAAAQPLVQAAGAHPPSLSRGAARLLPAPALRQAAGVHTHSGASLRFAIMGGPRLAAQSFGGNQLVRGTEGGQQSLAQILQQREPAPPQLMLVAERRVCVSEGGAASAAGGSGGRAAVRWFTEPALAQLQFRREEPGGEELRLAPGEEGGAAVRVPLYLLGRDAAGGWKLAADVSAVPQSRLAELQLGFRELRGLMPLLERGELAIAGHAVALSQWHQAHAFCPRCGAPTVSSEGGARRQCTADAKHRSYPRTDPVVIMLVESPDGRRALLGHSKKVHLPLYTCLAGFIDQGESIEEAVAREVREEAGVEVSAVDLLGSQPWPIGRGGSCELMIGCIARAKGEMLVIDPTEMEDVRWVDLADVRASVAAADSRANPYNGGRGVVEPGSGVDQPPYWIPPSVAIAHHLIRKWVDNGGGWFSEAAAPAAGQGQGQQQQPVGAARPSNL